MRPTSNMIVPNTLPFMCLCMSTYGCARGSACVKCAPLEHGKVEQGTIQGHLPICKGCWGQALKYLQVYHPCMLLAKKRYVGFSYESPNQAWLPSTVHPGLKVGAQFWLRIFSESGMFSPNPRKHGDLCFLCSTVDNLAVAQIWSQCVLYIRWHAGSCLRCDCRLQSVGIVTRRHRYLTPRASRQCDATRVGQLPR